RRICRLHCGLGRIPRSAGIGNVVRSGLYLCLRILQGLQPDIECNIKSGHLLNLPFERKSLRSARRSSYLLACRVVARRREDRKKVLPVGKRFFDKKSVGGVQFTDLAEQGFKRV